MLAAVLGRPGEVTVRVLSTCVHAQAGLGPAASAVVVGLGVSGLLHVQLLRERGVRTIVGVTRSAWKPGRGTATPPSR